MRLGYVDAPADVAAPSSGTPKYLALRGRPRFLAGPLGEAADRAPRSLPVLVPHEPAAADRGQPRRGGHEKRPAARGLGNDAGRARRPTGAWAASSPCRPQLETSPAPGPSPTGRRCSRRRGSTRARLRAVEPRWAASVDSDRKAAWEGAYPGQPGLEVRVEAAAYHGRPVWFEVLPPWARPGRMRELGEPTSRTPIAGRGPLGPRHRHAPRAASCSRGTTCDGSGRPERRLPRRPVRLRRLQPGATHPRRPRDRWPARSSGS